MLAPALLPYARRFILAAPGDRIVLTRAGNQQEPIMRAARQQRRYAANTTIQTNHQRHVRDTMFEIQRRMPHVERNKVPKGLRGEVYRHTLQRPARAARRHRPATPAVRQRLAAASVRMMRRGSGSQFQQN